MSPSNRLHLPIPKAGCRLLFKCKKTFKSSLHFYFLRLRSPGSNISAHFMILATSIGFSS